MKGNRKTRKRDPKVVSSPAAKKLHTEPDCDLTPVSPAAVTSPLLTPRRSTRLTQCLTSTPVRTPSTRAVCSIRPKLKQIGAKSLSFTTSPKISEVDSPSLRVTRRNRCRLDLAPQLKRVKRNAQQKQKATCHETVCLPVKRQCSRKKKSDTIDLKESVSAPSSQRIRPRFELKELDSAEQDESLVSSDLSIELSQHEERLPPLFLREEEESEEEEEEEELPSFLKHVDKKPITVGDFVWHKFRHFPYWPALVKSVHHKHRKATIVFIDYSIFEKTRGFAVSLKALKPFDCEDAKEMMQEAKEQHDAAVSWSLDLIRDYRIRIGCGSFSGSFIEYFAHDMSYPERKKYPLEISERLNIASDAIMLEEPCDDLKDLSFEKHQDGVKRSKRLLPDRTQAAFNRANEKLVHFIVKLRMAEGRLLDVISGQQQSRWLHSFLSTNKQCVNTYLEDEQQMDQVYQYLSDLYASAKVTAPCLGKVKSMECYAFVLEVLLPEAIITAIAGVDNVSVQKAEEKYLKGRCLSTRERLELGQMIEKFTRKRPQSVTPALSDPISKEIVS